MTPRMLSRLFFAFTLTVLVNAVSARAADLIISDLLISYQTQTESTATGQLTFNIRLVSDESDTLGFDLFSTQVLIREMISDGVNASFTLNESESEVDGPAKDAYWIESGIAGSANASSIGGEFRYSDFVPLGQAFVPSVNDVVAAFAIDFEVTEADQFGIYEIAPGNAGFNFFSRDLVVITPTNLEEASFEIAPIPEPATALLLLGGASAVIGRRRRSAICY